MFFTVSAYGHNTTTTEPPKGSAIEEDHRELSDLPDSCIFWIQLRLPVCCAPPNTHRLCGQLSVTKLQCSYRASKPSHSGMSHSCLSGGVRKDKNTKILISM